MNIVPEMRLEMHTNDMLKYGQYFFMNALEGVDEAHCNDEGVCGLWSVKDIIAHMASLEQLLIEVLGWINDNTVSTPNLRSYGELGVAWNDAEVDKRKAASYQAVLDEYLSAQARAAELIETVPLELQRKTGALTWYGAEYDLEDFIVYTYYGHKREHGAQINLFKTTNLK
jgi:hypothetical protein